MGYYISYKQRTLQNISMLIELPSSEREVLRVLHHNTTLHAFTNDSIILFKYFFQVKVKFF